MPDSGWKFTITTSDGEGSFSLTDEGKVIIRGTTSETQIDAEYLIVAFQAAADAMKAFLKLQPTTTVPVE